MRPPSGTEVEVLADSIGPCEIRLTTVRYRAPRFILAQINTHRQFSRNAASSRALSTEKILQSTTIEPAWRYRAKGMQPAGPMDERDAWFAERCWRDALGDSIQAVKDLLTVNCAKEIVNRLLEPFMWVEGVISSTSWDNFLVLRASDENGETEAQHEIQVLADLIRDVLAQSTPQRLQTGQWHLPYHDPERDKDLSEEQQRRVCVARLARATTYANTKEYSHKRDLRLFDRLVKPPIHASPLEHIAQATRPSKVVNEIACWAEEQGFRPHVIGRVDNDHVWIAEKSGNFDGWRQFREVVENRARGGA